MRVPILVIGLLLIVGLVCAQVPPKERDALTALYLATDGANWSDHTGWSDGVPDTECSWHGVTCAGGHVSQLVLSYNNLTGPLPDEIGALDELTVLDFRSNHLSGEILPEIGNLVALQEIYLLDNELTGPIPPTLGSLQNLRKLYLDSNSIDGKIPNELSLLSSLEYLSLGRNHLSGSIPASLGGLTNLRSLTLLSNRLVGRVPSTFRDLPLLNSIRMNYNALWTDDEALRAMLDMLNPYWSGSQTIAPTDVRFGPAQEDSIEVAWTRISYTSDNGGYQVYLSALPALFADGFEAGDSTAWGGLSPGALTTPSKYWAHLVAQPPEAPEGLLLVVRSFTLPHSDNSNTVFSEWVTAAEVQPPVYSCVSPANLLVNGCLDHSLSGWFANQGTFYYNASTGANSAGCGSFNGPTGFGSEFRAYSCVQDGIDGGSWYSFGATFKTFNQPQLAPLCRIEAETHDTPDCSGDPTTTVSRSVVFYGYNWIESAPASILTEPSTVAVNVILRCRGINHIYSNGKIDDVYFMPQTNVRKDGRHVPQ